MIAFDTNMLVRALVADNAEQVAVVRRLLAEDKVFISRTVLLETEWVLRSRYGKERDTLLAFFRSLIQLDDVVVEESQQVAQAVDWYAQGADFADALQLCGCGNIVMHTFDRNFCKAALARIFHKFRAEVQRRREDNLL